MSKGGPQDAPCQVASEDPQLDASLTFLLDRLCDSEEIRLEYRTLGRTGLRVSRVGIGTGGPSRFGQGSGVPEAEIHRLTHRALDLGINFFDTAAGYGESERILGDALEGVSRDTYVLATKVSPVQKGEMISPDDVKISIERSLRRLRVDCVDVFQFHAVETSHYPEIRNRMLPVARQLQEDGKCRFIGVTETYGRDNDHTMIPLALKDDPFDTAMIGYNLLSPGPEREALPGCARNNVGVICMVAVRRSLGSPERLLARIRDAKERGVIASDSLPDADPLGWLIKGHVTSIPDAAYKYVAAHPAIATVLTGTSKVDHLEANVKAILGPSLPDEDMVRLRSVFGEVKEPLGD